MLKQQMNLMNLLLRTPCSERHTGITDWIFQKHWDTAHLCSFFPGHLTRNTDLQLMAPGVCSKMMDNMHMTQSCSDI